MSIVCVSLNSIIVDRPFYVIINKVLEMKLNALTQSSEQIRRVASWSAKLGTQPF